MAKEAKTVRAAALSVGIFMMTGAAGAVPAFANVTAFLRLGDTLLSGPSAPSSTWTTLVSEATYLRRDHRM